MLKGLAGKTVLVTGAAGGIGSAACRRLADEGANVVATDISDEALRVVAEALGDRGVGVAADITTSAGVAASIDAAAAFGGIDLAFLNAGVECFAAPVAEFSEAEYERVFNVNVRGAFLAAQAVVNHLTAARPVRQHPVHGVDRRAQRQPDHVDLQRVEARRRRSVEVPRARGRPTRHPRQRAVPGRGRHAHDAVARRDAWVKRPA